MEIKIQLQTFGLLSKGSQQTNNETKFRFSHSSPKVTHNKMLRCSVECITSAWLIRRSLMLVQFLYMEVSIAAWCIVTDNMGPISHAWISTVPAAEISMWIYQAALNSLESINCRADEPILDKLSLRIVLQERNLKAWKNNCDNISSTANLYIPLLSSKGHVYKIKVKCRQMTNMQRSSQVKVCMQSAVNKKDLTFPWCSDLCSSWLQKGKR